MRFKMRIAETMPILAIHSEPSKKLECPVSIEFSITVGPIERLRIGRHGRPEGLNSGEYLQPLIEKSGE
jgi:hypothetical protein